MKHKLLLTALSLLPALSSFAFEYTHEGQTLNYEMLDEAAKTCSVAQNDGISGAVIIPEKVKFNGNTYAVTQIGDLAFENYVHSNNVTSVIIPNSVTIIGERAFEKCRGLTSVDIPNSVTSIGYGAFVDCRISSITLPNSVVSIGEYAFAMNDYLISVTIPGSVIEIGDYAFGYCENLKEVYYNTTRPIKADNSIFLREEGQYSHVYDDGTLYIAVGGLASVMFVEPWCLFKNIKEKDFSGIEEVTADYQTAPIEVYVLNGVKVADSADNLPAGFYIIRQGNQCRKVVVR